VRVLVTGATTFRDGLHAALNEVAAELVGHARSVDEAVLLIQSLRPDVVVLEPRLSDGLDRIASVAPVVSLGDVMDVKMAANREDLAVLDAALALTAAEPHMPRLTSVASRS
jgi:DNA-binding NarL/FixJ family response regulator